MADEIETGTEKKEWYRSKTVWLNILAVVAIVAQSQMGMVISTEEQMGVLAVLNLILRLITTQGLK